MIVAFMIPAPRVRTGNYRWHRGYVYIIPRSNPGGEASAEVARGGGVGDAVGAQGVEEDEIVASQLDIVETGPIEQGVVGEVQDTWSDSWY
jgi:hypothetical protein